MSLELLISNWAGDRIRRCFHINGVGDADLTQFDLIFVATLWSGKSQLAFRLLCECMEKTESGPRVLVLDYDGDLPDIVTLTIPPLEIASGCIVSLRHGSSVALGSGEHLNDLRFKLQKMFSVTN